MSKLIDKQLEALTGATIEPIDVTELQKEADRTCVTVRSYVTAVEQSAEEWLDVLNEVSSCLEEFVMDEQMQCLMKRLDKVIDGVYELSRGTDA